MLINSRTAYCYYVLHYDITGYYSTTIQLPKIKITPVYIKYYYYDNAVQNLSTKLNSFITT